MITAIELENFKGVGTPVRIPIRPITLLFGANSAGKSTVLQALQYAYEILVNGNIDVDLTELGQNYLNFGGFSQIVHNRILKNEVRLTFELDLSEEEISAFGVLDEDDKVLTDYFSTAEIEILLGWSELEKAPLVRKYAVKIDGAELASISQDKGKKYGVFAYYDMTHPLAKSYFGDEEALSQVIWEPMPLDNLASVIPVWGKPLKFIYQPDIDYVEGGELLLSQVLVGIGEVLVNDLQRMRHIGPIREIIGRNFEGVRSLPRSRWYNGLGAWDHFLYRAGKAEVEKVSDWLLDGTKLNTGYGIEVLDGLEAANSDATIIDQHPSLREALRKKVIKLVSNTGAHHTLHDVGVGFSQLIPIVIGALARSSRILSVEQPELHVHPRVQVGLGDLFASQIHERPGAMFLIETHSEHLILRLIRRIREANERELPAGAPHVSPNDISIVYMESENGEMRVTPLRLDETGEFMDEWPAGFFEEREEELF